MEMEMTWLSIPLARMHEDLAKTCGDSFLCFQNM